MYLDSLVTKFYTDTDLAEMIMPFTRTQVFNSTLEIQQSRPITTLLKQFIADDRQDILSTYNLNDQLVTLENLIAQKADRRMVLRMLVLASITMGGIKAKQLENLKREVLQVSRFVCVSTPSLNYHTDLWI